MCDGHVNSHGTLVWAEIKQVLLLSMAYRANFVSKADIFADEALASLVETVAHKHTRHVATSCNCCEFPRVCYKQVTRRNQTLYSQSVLARARLPTHGGVTGVRSTTA